MLRALIVTNMWPTPSRPALGSFVSDQVDALRATGEAEVSVFAFGAARVAGVADAAGATGDPRTYLRAARRLHHAHRHERFDVVHAHFGLSAWPARAARGTVHAVTLHGTDVVHPRSRALTLAALPTQSLVAVTSEALAALVPRWATRGRPPAILPTGVNLARFAPAERTAARRALGLRPDGRYLLFPADPARPEKRAGDARALAGASGAELITLGSIPPDAVPAHIQAADAVLVTSARESFGLAALEALACEVPVLSTPVGIAPALLRDLPGTLCAPFDLSTWSAALASVPSRLTGGRERAAHFSSDACARAVLDAWRAAVAKR